MLSRERILNAIKCAPVDRVPADFGSHPNASIHILAYKELKEYLGIDKPIQIQHRWMQTARVDEEVLKLFNIDTRPLYLGSRDRPLEHDVSPDGYIDQWGILRTKPNGRLYYDVKKSPLCGEISIHQIASFPWPDPYDAGVIRGLRLQAEKLHRETDYAIVLNLPSAFIHTTQFMRGFEDWFIDCASNPYLLRAMFDAVIEVNAAFAEHVLGEIGDLIDVIVTSDDLGSQVGLLVSPNFFRRWIKPRLRRYFEIFHRLSEAKVIFHSCGSIYLIIDDLIEIGIDVLNPVQTRAANMEPDRLIEKTAKRLCLWGGIDTQHVLPFYTPDEVTAYVLHSIQTFSGKSGYVLCPTHNIQPGVPAENICALYKADRTVKSLSYKFDEDHSAERNLF